MKTTDIVLATFLKLKGFHILKINPNQSFSHGNVEIDIDMDDPAIQEYDRGDGRVEPIAFNSTLRSILLAIRGR